MKDFVQNTRDILLIFASAVVILGIGPRAFVTFETAIQNISYQVSK